MGYNYAFAQHSVAGAILLMHYGTEMNAHILGSKGQSSRSRWNTMCWKQHLVFTSILGGGIPYSTTWRRVIFNIHLVFGPRRRVPRSHSSCSSAYSWNQFIKGPKIPKAFLVRSGAQRNFAYMLTLPTDLPYQIFHLFSA